MANDDHESHSLCRASVAARPSLRARRPAAGPDEGSARSPWPA